MAKDLKPFNLDDENETTNDDMSSDSLNEENAPTDEITNDILEEESEVAEELPVEPIEEDTEEEKVTDAQEVQNVMLAYFSKETEKTIRKFFEVFLRATDEYPDLSMQDYKSFLETIEQNVPESDFPKYKELFAKVLVARKKRIQEHDQKRMLEESKAETLKEIEDTYQQIDHNKYTPTGLSTIEKAYGNAKNQVEQENNPKNLNLISKRFESSIRSVKTKKQASRKKIFIISGAVAAVLILLAAILCIGAIPKVSYEVVSTTEELVKNQDGEYEEITVKNVKAEGISGLFLPFHYPMKTVDLRYVSDENFKLIGIEEGAFKGESIESVYIPYNITVIPEEAFANCKNLKEINYFEGVNDLSYVTAIKEDAFMGCTSLKSITISNHILSISRLAFEGCNKDFEIIFAGNSSDWAKKYISLAVPFRCYYYNVTYNPDITVKFNSLGGSSIPSQKVTSSNPLKYPTIPTRNGYIFAGWYMDTNYWNEFDFTEQLSEDITLYAKWESPTNYAGIVNVNSKTGKTVNYSSTTKYYAFVPLVTQTYTIYSTGTGDVIGYLYDSDKYTLDSKDSGGEGNNFSISYYLTANTLYYIGVNGFYSTGTCQLYVTGDKTTPTVTSQISSYAGFSDTITYGNKYTLPVYQKSGLTFKGYYLEPTFKTKITDASGASLVPWTFAKDIIVYAKYE